MVQLLPVLTVVVIGGALALEPVKPRVGVAARRGVLVGGGGSVLAQFLAGAPAVAAEDAPIDMDKIRALSQKGREGLNLAAPRDRDPRDRSLKEVTLGWNGAVVRLEPEEAREMERVGLLVKDGFRGRPPDYLSLRDFQPRGWYSAPAESQLTGLDRVNTAGADRAAMLRERSAAINAAVEAKVAAVGKDPAPDGWIPPVPDDGAVCGLGAYATKCADKSPGQKLLDNAAAPLKPPPEKLKFEPVIETLSRKYLGGDSGK